MLRDGTSFPSRNNSDPVLIEFFFLLPSVSPIKLLFVLFSV